MIRIARWCMRWPLKSSSVSYVPATKVRAFILLGDVHFGVRDLPAALSAYQQAQRSVEEALEKDGALPQLMLWRSDIQAKTGLLHFHLRNLDKSIGCYNEALRILEQVVGPDTAELALRKVRLFNNMAGVYIQRRTTPPPCHISSRPWR